MFKDLLAHTALPNLHPAVVHLPIALLLIALPTDLLALSMGRRQWIANMGVTLWILGAVGAALAYWSGHQAHESLELGPRTTLDAIDAHAEWGFRTLVAAVVMAVVRLGVVFLGLRRPRLVRPALFLSLVGGVGVVWILVETADLGGSLVYRHGVAVRAKAPAGLGCERATPDAADGSSPPTSSATRPDLKTPGPPYMWLDGQTSETHPARLVRGTLATIREEQDGPVDDRAWSFHLGARKGPVRIEGYDDVDDVDIGLDIDTSRFDGRISILHHIAGDGAEDAFVFEAAKLRLERRAARSSPKIIDSDEVSLKPGRHIFRVVASGKHQEAFADQTLRLHGHETGLRGGRVGLELEGHGTVRLYQWTVRRIGD